MDWLLRGWRQLKHFPSDCFTTLLLIGFQLYENGVLGIQHYLGASSPACGRSK